VVTEHNLYKKIRDIDLCAEFEMLEVKEPIIFVAWVGGTKAIGSIASPISTTSQGSGSLLSCKATVLVALSVLALVL
jgi:hypothetical protein